MQHYSVSVVNRRQVFWMIGIYFVVALPAKDIRLWPGFRSCRTVVVEGEEVRRGPPILVSLLRQGER